MMITSSNPYETQTQQIDHDQYIMDSSNKIVGWRQGGRFNQSIILLYKDNSEWVFLNNKPEERFCGYLYLQKAIKELNLKNLQAAENKISIHDKNYLSL